MTDIEKINNYLANNPDGDIKGFKEYIENQDKIEQNKINELDNMMKQYIGHYFIMKLDKNKHLIFEFNMDDVFSYGYTMYVNFIYANKKSVNFDYIKYDFSRNIFKQLKDKPFDCCITEISEDEFNEFLEIKNKYNKYIHKYDNLLD